MRKVTRRVGVLAVAAGLVLGTAASAWAVTITAPASNPFTVPDDGAGHPVPFDITASGFSDLESVFVQQCDGVDHTTPGYSATDHCDLASGNAPAIAHGTTPNAIATFPASNSNIRLRVFKGMSPQGLFNCLAPNDPPTNNGLPDWKNCQVRVSGSTPGDTSEQAYFNIVLPNAPVVTTTTTTTIAPTTTTTVPTNNTIGSCSGVQFLGSIVPPLAGSGAPTNTVASLKAAKAGLVVYGVGFAFSVTTTGAGSCTIGANSFNDVVTSAKLSGAASCNSASTDPSLYPLNGKLKLSYVAKTLSTQGYVRVAGFDPVPGPDVISLTGIVTKGGGVGATIGGEVFFDPVIKALVNGEAGGPELKGQYYFDNSQVVTPCGSSPTAPSVGLIYGGDGGSLLGSVASGLTLSF